MKYIALIALAAMAIGLGACAHHEETAPTTTTVPASHGYRK
jgi:hypothetical protein